MGGSSDSPFKYRAPLIPVPELKLDPKIVAMIQEIEAEVAARRTIQLWLQPNWRAAEPDLGRLILSMPGGMTPPPPQPPGAGPATPRAGQVGDVIRALWQTSMVQQQVQSAYSELHRQLSVAKNDWNKSTTAEKFGIVTFSGLIAGSALSMVMITPELRAKILDFADGKDIPVPYVDGLSFQIRKRGGQVTIPMPLPGLSVQAGAGQGTGSRPVDWDFTLTLDVAKYLRSRNVTF